MTRSDFGGPVEDFALELGSVTGVRGFRVLPSGFLHGITHVEAVYGPGVNIAKCHMCGTKDIANCTCGFYAYFSGDRSRMGFMEYGDVGAIVRGYGRTVVGTRGFRASKSDLVALFPLRGTPKVAKRSPFRWLYPAYSAMAAIGKSSELTVLSGFLFLGLVVFAGAMGIPLGIYYENWVLTAISAFMVVFGGPWTAGWLRRVEAGSNIDFRYLYPNAPAHLMRLVRGEPNLSDQGPLACAAKLYPGIPVYGSMEEALQNHPVSEAPEPAPKLDLGDDDVLDYLLTQILKRGL